VDSYKIEVVKSADKDARRISKQDISRILKAIRSLANNPFPPQHKKMKGSENEYRIRVGDYRVIYEVDIENKLITIFHIRHRKDVYRR